ncbi:MAG: helix-turn-helix domain-containing protein [Tessaracoccus sp.]|uniref:helix-turn-helix domain-containing protein n=1 Tax=Tessaracoccus sp. TaxID=1971211 RepID=UPI001EC28456|nr:helix-turn-helix domain-containing protein [Tessaracoccus sp.]MBK7823448.1 helix-turn-helix domain-containing protein [Tessaracoccus sp.]
MHLSDGDWLTCGAGHQHPGPRRLEREWRRKAPMPTRELCEALRVPDSTLRKWRERGKLRPTREEGRVCWWLPWDVIALRYPDIVTAIDDRDQGAA